MFLLYQVSKKTKVPIQALKSYEKLGLISGKKNNGIRKTTYTYYDVDTVEKVELIEECKDIGMTIPQISRIIKLWYGIRIPNVKRAQLLSEQIQLLDAKQEKIKDMTTRLQLLLTELEKFS